jgi:Domain of unknown function (DUF4375)
MGHRRGEFVSELPFLNRYRGESLDELIAMEGRYRTDSIVVTIHQLLLDKQRLSEAERTVIVIEALERDVNNGGFHQFFMNGPEHAAEIVVALRRIGSPEAADLAQRAVDALRLGPAPSAEAVKAVIHDADDQRDGVLHGCDESYYANAAGQIGDQLFAYIKANRNEIDLSQLAARW